jgi:hypothetical protein
MGAVGGLTLGGAPYNNLVNSVDPLGLWIFYDTLAGKSFDKKIYLSEYATLLASGLTGRAKELADEYNEIVSFASVRVRAGDYSGTHSRPPDKDRCCVVLRIDGETELERTSEKLTGAAKRILSKVKLLRSGLIPQVKASTTGHIYVEDCKHYTTLSDLGLNLSIGGAMSLNFFVGYEVDAKLATASAGVNARITVNSPSVSLIGSSTPQVHVTIAEEIGVVFGLSTPGSEPPSLDTGTSQTFEVYPEFKLKK